MLIDEIQNTYDLLDRSIKSLKRTSEAYAKAERDYKILSVRSASNSRMREWL